MACLFRPLVACFAVVAIIALQSPAHADAIDGVQSPVDASQSENSNTNQDFAFHAQSTFVAQGNAPFRAAFDGPNSLNHHGQVKETFDLTLYAGMRPWNGAQIWVDPEIDQGFGLSNTLGVAGFPSGEAYKVGKSSPYVKLQRWFFRQTIDLGGESEKDDADLNQFAGGHTANLLILTVGKFSVVDVFDTNEQAHDPRNDFLNWAVIDAATFDYAANAWGYTYGAAAEIHVGRWAFRAGLFDLSQVPNSIPLDPHFAQYEINGEIEGRHSIGGRQGKLKITVFLNHGRMGRFADALNLADATGQPPDTAAVRRMRNRAGASFNFEQPLSKATSFFLKGGIADGKAEPFEFIDVDRSIAAGATIKGVGWARNDDTVGLAVVDNVISPIHRRYLDEGGLGILVGDGKLPHPGSEQIVETYYGFAATKVLRLTLDYQFINHPAYNRDRGPVSVGALRLHAQF